MFRKILGLLRHSGYAGSTHNVHVSEKDSLAKQAIEAARHLGAKTSREAAEITMGRKLTDDEWKHYKDAWERNW